MSVDSHKLGSSPAETGAPRRASARTLSNDHHLEKRLGLVLRVGARVSSLLLGAGLVLSLTLDDSTVAVWLMTGGLLLLMATPVARVAVAVVEYAVQRDWAFFALTTIVLLELCGGVIAALVFHRRL
jgi:uncharacterized membrane protein